MLYTLSKVMNPEKFLAEIRKQQMRFFPEARFVVMEELSFYAKIRLVIKEELFIEVRCNFRSLGQSYVLVKQKERIAGFDNLSGWHFHPPGKADTHQKIRKPSLEEIFEKFHKLVFEFA